MCSHLSMLNFAYFVNKFFRLIDNCQLETILATEVGGGPSGPLIGLLVPSGISKPPASFSFITLNPSQGTGFPSPTSLVDLLLNSIAFAILKNSSIPLFPVNLLPSVYASISENWIPQFCVEMANVGNFNIRSNDLPV